MAKQPEAGATKTRLVPYLTPREAADLYECLLRDTLGVVGSATGIELFIAVWPSGAERYFREIAPGVPHVHQVGDSLGERLDHVLSRLLASGFDQVAAIGGDVPTLPAEHVTRAFARLDDDTVDVVLDPSEDGGYHLIGWKRPHPTLVRGVTMSTPNVLDDTIAIAAREGLSIAMLPGWYDVDVPADVERLEVELARRPKVAPHTRRFLEALRHGGRPGTQTRTDPSDV